MRFFYSALAFSLCAASCHAQAPTDGARFLEQVRAKYDAPFERNLQSFTCAVEFNWKQHFTEAVRLGTKERTMRSPNSFSPFTIALLPTVRTPQCQPECLRVT